MSNPQPSSDERDFLKTHGEEGFADLFVRSREKLKQMLRYKMDPRLRARTDLSDILQETYIEAFKRLDSFLETPHFSFYIWLRQVTLQRLIDIHRKHLLTGKRDVKNEVASAGHPLGATSSYAIADQLVDQFVSPSQLAIREEMLSQVERSLESMEEIDREVLALRHFEELGNTEVAAVLGLSAAAASNRYVRALSRLRKDLKSLPDFFDEI